MADVGVRIFDDGACRDLASFDIVFENQVVGHFSKVAGEVVPSDPGMREIRGAGTRTPV
jgi:hypothetical protein